MIAICLSNKPPILEIEIELAGLPKDLRDVQQLILNLIQNEDAQVCAVRAAAIDPSPYDGCLDSLSIRKGNSSIKVSVSANSLQIEGEPKKLEIFADWFNFSDDTRSGYHVHFDYFENEKLVDANSNSLVIAVRSSVKYLDTV